MDFLTAQELNSANPYAHPDELTAVRDIANRLDNEANIVMIGAGPGVFALAMLERRKDPPLLNIIEIDTFHWVMTHLEAAGCDLRLVRCVGGDSSTIGKTWEQPVDFLLVDGDHTFEGVTKDVAAWLPHVKPRHLVFFHDYFERPGGFNGVEEWDTGGCAEAVKTAIREGYLIHVEYVGVGIICRRTEKVL